MPPLAELLPNIIDVSVAILLFVVWYFTFKDSNATHKEISENNLKAVDQLTKQMAGAYKDSIELHKSQNEKLMQILKEDQENEAALINALTQLKERLNQPVKCPIAEAQKVNQNKDT